MGKARQVSETVGKRLREWREAAGLRQEDVARAARECGLDWKAATVGVIETGRRDVNLQEFLALPVVMSTLSDQGREDYPPDPQHLLGPFAPLLEVPSEGQRESHKDLAIAAGGESAEPENLWLEAQGQTERTAARQLSDDRDVPLKPVDIAHFARRLWDRSLTDERDARARERAAGETSPRSLQALRGHVTRELLDELRKEIDAADHARDEVAGRLYGRPFFEELEARLSERVSSEASTKAREREWAAVYRELAREVGAAMEESEEEADG